MRIFKEKGCKECGSKFIPTYPCNLYCSVECALPNSKEARRKAAYKHWVNKKVAEGKEHVIGVGKGGSNPKGADHPQYKNGVGGVLRGLKRIVKDRRYCERCSKDLQDSNSYGWCTHHKDHDRNNNVLENLELLCKRCHQVEHTCWKAFEGATTIPKGSTPKSGEAPDTQNG